MVTLVGETLANYHILERVGQGGMASVYRAFDLKRERPVALKILSWYLVQDEKFKSRFDREIKLLQQLEHPHIVPILDHQEVDGAPLIVMPYIQGGTLRDRLESGPLSAREAALLVSEISSALEFAHQKGVIHRDVKPSNILNDEDGTFLLSDFGFAQWQEASLSLTGSALIGTPAYMSPEQCKGGEIDHRSDQYALAVVLYRVATGKLPFDGDTPLALAIKQINEPIPMPRELNPKLPRAIENVLVKALAKEPDHRFSSVGQFNEAFQEALLQTDGAAGRMTVILPSTELSRRIVGQVRSVKDRALDRVKSMRKPAVIGALLLLLGLPLGAAALGGVLTGGADPTNTPGTSQANLQATISLLRTENAPGEGANVPAGGVETSVAGTLSALVSSPDDAQTSEPTPNPDLVFPDPSEGTGTPTSTSSSGGTSVYVPSSTQAEDTSSPPLPSDTPNPSHTPATPPGETPLPTPTATLTVPPPTYTIPPPPTATATQKCNSGVPEGHKFYCTPTPTPE